MTECACDGYFDKECDCGKSAVDPLVKCWQIEPYHCKDADFCIVPIRGEQSHHDALEYAKQRLEDQWDATAHDETIVPRVEMKIITMRESDLEEMPNYT